MTCDTCGTMPAAAGPECHLCRERRERRERASAAQRRRRAEKGLPADWNERSAAQMRKMRDHRRADGLTVRGETPKRCRGCGGYRPPGLVTPYCPACKAARDEAKAVRAKATAERRAIQDERDRRLQRLLRKGGQDE